MSETSEGPASERQSLDQNYFDGLYKSSRDPWNFETSPYEREKYERTLRSFSRNHYRSGFEVGCSIGVLTEKLAPGFDALLSVDIAKDALETAKKRCARFTNVTFELMAVPGQWPTRVFDLILLSEVIYYFNKDDLAKLADRVRGSLEPGGDCILVHWTEKTDYPLQGDEACSLFIDRLRDFAPPVSHDRQKSYRIDVLQRPAA